MNRQPGTLLQTDDDLKLLAQVTYALRDAGHIVFAAYNGSTACQEATGIPNLDLYIMNTRLRGLDAAELIRRIREARPTLLILHIGDPLPLDEFTRNVPTLREPVTPEAPVKAVGALLAGEQPQLSGVEHGTQRPRGTGSCPSGGARASGG